MLPGTGRARNVISAAQNKQVTHDQETTTIETSIDMYGNTNPEGSQAGAHVPPGRNIHRGLRCALVGTTLVCHQDQGAKAATQGCRANWQQVAASTGTRPP